MKRLNPSLVDLMKLSALFLCMAFWSVGSLYAASDVSVSKDVGSNAAKPATLKKNNVRMGPSQLSTHGPALPDLIIQSISISPLRPTTRDEIRLSVAVKNSGTAASRMCQLEIKIGGEARGHRFKVPVLAPKRTHIARRTVTLPVALRYRSTARIDVDNRNAESDESNNEKTFDFTVNPEPRPDLVIQRITISPENPTTADEITLTVVVKNIGNEGSRSCQLEIRAGGEGRSPRYLVPVLAPNRTHTARRTLTLPVALTYRSTATIDVDSRNTESDERNNQEVLDFTVRSGV